MTREEAIGTMNFLKLYAETHTEVQDAIEEKDRVRFIEAVEMAISALEQQPCEDAVSRDAVIEATHNCGDLQELRGVVQQLPSVTRQTEQTEPCRTCKYGEIYNDEWCRCTYPKISGCRVKIKNGCEVELYGMMPYKEGENNAT